MSEETDKTGEAPEDPVVVDEGLILELNFVPDWAKEPPDKVRHYAEDDHRSRRRPRDRDDGRRGPRQDRRGKGPPRGGDTGRRPDRDRRPSRDASRPDRRPNERPHREGPRERHVVELPPVVVRFLPEQKPLAAVARRLIATKKCYSLMDVASLFFSKPNSCYVRIEPGAGADGIHIYQCKRCRVAALDRAMLLGHYLQAHVDEHFEKEELVVEPPSGQFVCVAKCGLSGALLGPVNHHSYAGKVEEVRRTRYPHMSAEAYRARIQTSRDPAVIEQWKEESRRQVVYRLKKTKDEEAEPMKWHEAEAYVEQHIAPKMIVESRRVTLPLAIARRTSDPGLMQAINAAVHKEERFPLSLSLALRAAFRHKHLHLFKAGKGIDFVTAIHPNPLDLEHAVDDIKEVLAYLQQNPGCKRAQLVEALHPGVALDSPDARKVLSPLRWLVERGHIIEFFDGSLSVPLSVKAPKRAVAPRRPHRRPRHGGGKPPRNSKEEKKVEKPEADDSKPEADAPKPEADAPKPEADAPKTEADAPKTEAPDAPPASEDAAAGNAEGKPAES